MQLQCHLPSPPSSLQPPKSTLLARVRIHACAACRRRCPLLPKAAHKPPPTACSLPLRVPRELGKRPKPVLPTCCTAQCFGAGYGARRHCACRRVKRATKPLQNGSRFRSFAGKRRITTAAYSQLTTPPPAGPRVACQRQRTAACASCAFIKCAFNCETLFQNNSASTYKTRTRTRARARVNGHVPPTQLRFLSCAQLQAAPRVLGCDALWRRQHCAAKDTHTGGDAG